MAKGILSFEFSSIAELVGQLRQALGCMAEMSTLPPLTLGGKGYVYPDPDALPEPAPEANPEPAVEKPKVEPAVETPAAPLGDAPCKVVELTPEAVKGASWEDLLEFCRQNPGVGQSVEKEPPKFLRLAIEHKIRAFLTTK